MEGQEVRVQVSRETFRLECFVEQEDEEEEEDRAVTSAKLIKEHEREDTYVYYTSLVTISRGTNNSPLFYLFNMHIPVSMLIRNYVTQLIISVKIRKLQKCSRPVSDNFHFTISEFEILSPG